MEKAMKTARYQSPFFLVAMLTTNLSGSGTQRAWQALPRHLRRRAASHDVRRVPARLRERAKTEVSDAVTWHGGACLILPIYSLDGPHTEETSQ